MSFAWTTLLLLIPFMNASRCPGPEWISRRGTSDCYYFQHPTTNVITDVKLTWQEARRECQTKGGALVDIRNTDELDYITSKLGKTPAQNVTYWTGLECSYGLIWIWADVGRNFTYGELGDHSPGNSWTSTTERRGVLVLTPKGLQDNAVQRFSNLNHYICKAKYSSRPLCKTEEGWDFANGRCWLYKRDPVTWNTARQTCRSNGGYIAVPSTAEEDVRLWQRTFNTMHVNSGWIGIGFNKSRETLAASVKWEDGTELLTAANRNMWFYGKLEANLTDEINILKSSRSYCGYLEYNEIFRDKWYLKAGCSDRKPYACETSPEKCPFGWHDFEDYCYQIRASDEDVRPFRNASEECRDQGGSLADINNQTLQDFISIGILVQCSAGSVCPDLWVGTSDGLECGSYNKLTGLKTADCSEELGFICQAHHTNVLQTEIIREPLSCVRPFKQFYDGCFLVVNQEFAWDDAQGFCRDLNSSLVEIENGGENKFLKEFLRAPTWIGIKRTFPSETTSYLHYANGKNMTDESFENFKPVSVVNKTYSCFAMLPAKVTNGNLGGTTWGQWEADNCATEKPFICYHRGSPPIIFSMSSTELTSEPTSEDTSKPTPEPCCFLESNTTSRNPFVSTVEFGAVTEFPTTTQMPIITDEAADCPSVPPILFQCRRGDVVVSDSDFAYSDATSAIFDGDDTIKCRIKLYHIQQWINAAAGLDQLRTEKEPVEVQCKKGQLFVSDTDIDGSVATSLTFDSMPNPKCQAIFHGFLTFVSGLQ